jgi:NADPH:quinone reductase
MYCTKRATHLCIARQLPGHTLPGTHAEYVVAAADAVVPTPANLSDEAAVPIVWAYGTALHMINVAELRIGDAVLVTAAASAMGIACMQLARLAGAATIIALTRSEAKHERLREAGADLVLDHRDPDAISTIQRLVGAIGVDVVLDNHGSQELVNFGLDAADLEGRFVMITSEAERLGDTVAIEPLRMIGKHMSIRGCRASTRWEQEEVLRMAGRGQISMPIAEVLPLSEIRAAHEHQAASAHVGKIVLTV